MHELLLSSLLLLLLEFEAFELFDIFLDFQRPLHVFLVLGREHVVGETIGQV